MSLPAILQQSLTHKIYSLRGYKVMLDSDLAEVFGIPTKQLNQVLKRNLHRFQEDFAFQLTENEQESLMSQIVISNADLRSQIVTSSSSYGGRRYLPYVFTEHGTIMMATLLKSERAVEMSIYIVRAFVAMRDMISQTKELAHKIEALEEKLTDHDETILAIIRTLKDMTNQKPSDTKPIGYLARNKENA